MQPLRGSVAHVSWSIGLSIGPGIALGFYGNSSEADLKVASEILSRDPWQTSGRLRRRILKLRGEIYSGCQVDWIRRGTNKNASYSTGWRIRKKKKDGQSCVFLEGLAATTAKLAGNGDLDGVVVGIEDAATPRTRSCNDTRDVLC